MQTTSSSKSAVSTLDHIHFFDDALTLGSWVFSGCCNIKQELHKIGGSQQMRVAVANLVPNLRSCAVQYTHPISNCGVLGQNANSIFVFQHMWIFFRWFIKL